MTSRDAPLGIDLTICDREPIHTPGAIQPHGVLLAIDPDDMRIVQIAGDTQALLGASHRALLGQSVEARLGAVAATRLTRIVAGAAGPRSCLGFETEPGEGAVALEGAVHVGEGAILVELEPCRGGAERDPLGLVQKMLASAAAAETIDAYAEAVARETAHATGFDHVMVYRFLPDGSGSVIAETMTEERPSYLGLRFPASDIPAQARKLYLTNWLRLIPDARYTPAPIEPALSPKTGRPLDLCHSALRSVSPVHLRYLANMGVRASMSLSIVVGGKLFGLVACHHRTPHFLDMRRRAACELFAQMISFEFQSRSEAEAAKLRMRAGEVQSRLVGAMSGRADLAGALLGGRPNLLDLIEADGCAVFVDGKCATLGGAPSAEQIGALLHWMHERSKQGVFATDRLPLSYAPAEAFGDVAAGVLAIAVSREPKDYVLFFRGELRQVVRWAGNPAKAVEADGPTLTPRASFEAWEETVRLQSRAWSDGEIEVARSLRFAILEVFVHALDLAMRERQAAQARQDFLMAELDHRVKNTLSVIQSLVRFTARSAVSLEDFNATLQSRLLTMARVQSLLTQSRWEGLSIRAIVDDELAPFRQAKENACQMRGEPIALKPKAALAVSMAIHELATNAAKYGALSAPGGRVRVEWRRRREKGEERLLLTWKESGGPVVAPPKRSGFGRMLIERTMAIDLGGEAELDFAPSGVECRLRIPVSQIAFAKGPRESGGRAASAAEPAAGSLSHRRVLLVEDAALVALSVREVLEEWGMEIAQTCTTVWDGLRAALRQDFDVALLDIDLDGEPVWPVADALAEAHVPFVFTTGFESRMVVPPRFAGRPVAPKPYSPEELVGALSRALSGEAAP
ncbi:GAF domain-containing protein [Methylosinus sp. H3A]|uniref:HWE histidine kinase domain-containing protein n=1 Tax=Methylosinus sp. H3A TaxID=2785786 RepID=UPI0018C26E20|nr:HWE histidine kinase domain-containing protein [Methylosinus sp. H3A]MBG0811978.1 GAF domain-containing protein [Methylosinus sp. H3A]